jgi:hypothetical protein
MSSDPRLWIADMAASTSDFRRIGSIPTFGIGSLSHICVCHYALFAQEMTIYFEQSFNKSLQYRTVCGAILPGN